MAVTDGCTVWVTVTGGRGVVTVGVGVGVMTVGLAEGVMTVGLGESALGLELGMLTPEVPPLRLDAMLETALLMELLQPAARHTAARRIAERRSLLVSRCIPDPSAHHRVRGR